LFFTHGPRIVLETFQWVKRRSVRLCVIEEIFIGKRWRGGIRYIFKESCRVRWVPAIRVADPVKILEKVEQLGGTVLVHPDEPPSNGDVALISDTSGALLMLQRWSPEQTEEAR